MNCKHVEELLPLYAGHDLEDGRAGLITAHLQTCTQCARSAAEYDEANQLTQQFAGPQFSEASYATVRQNVLREIERESATPTLRESLLAAFQPRLTWAVSTAVLLAVCAFAYYFVNRTTGPENNRQLAVLPGNAGGSPKSAPDSRKPRLDLAGRQDPVVPSPAGSLHAPAATTNSHKSRLNQTGRHNSTAGYSVAAAMSSRKPLLNQTAWHSTNAGEPPAVPANAVVSSGKPMRLEIQTRDPNIRIIWFSQPSTHEGSPTESSKGI